MKFDHSKNNIVEAVGIPKERAKLVEDTLTEMVKDVNHSGKKLSEIVEMLYKKSKKLKKDELVLMLFIVLSINRRILVNAEKLSIVVPSLSGKGIDYQEIAQLIDNIPAHNFDEMLDTTLASLLTPVKSDHKN